MNMLLVEPSFPIPSKSRNHHNFLPIGLLKLASYHRSTGHRIKLVRGNRSRTEIGAGFRPEQVLVTSLFTYWSQYVRDCVQHYKSLYPEAKAIVGGIYASLMPEHCKENTGCDEVHVGLVDEAEKFPPAYELVEDENLHPVDYQILHASRGCIRECPFCGVWGIEPRFVPKPSIKDEVKAKKLVFYDNNFLANPHIENVLRELRELKRQGNILWCECQSGFDGRVLQGKPHLARVLKEAGFVYPRIAWDWAYEKNRAIQSQVRLLVEAGYRTKDIYVFMLHNWAIPFGEMEKKRTECWKWRVQIADCRYRPLDQTYDDYNSIREQTSEDYYIHPKWSDAEIKQFRRNVRRQNICVRLGRRFYSKTLENKGVDRHTARTLNAMPRQRVTETLEDAWFPDAMTCAHRW